MSDVHNDVPSAPAERFAAAPYQPDGGFETGGVVAFACAMIVAGGAVGYAASWISTKFWLVMAFPVVMGAILGGVAVWSIKRGRVRNPLVAGAVSLLGALFMMGVVHYADYGRFKGTRAEAQPDFLEFQQAPAEQREAFLKSEEEAGGQIDFVRQQKRREAEDFLRMVDVRGFGSYLAWESGQGIRISSSHGGSSDKGLPITGIGVYIYWAVEVVLAAGVAFVMGRSTSRQPYSTRAGAWMQSRILGGLDPSRQALAVAALNEGSLSKLREADPRPGGGPLILTAYAAPADAEPGAEPQEQADEFVVLKLQTVNEKGGHGDKAAVTWPAAAMPALEELFRPTPPALAV